MTIDAVNSIATLVQMQANLKLNPVTGKITQTCSTAQDCFDAFGSSVFKITVTVQPLGGVLPLVRSFKISVFDIG